MDPARLATLLAVKPGEWHTVAAPLSIESKSCVGATLFGAHLHEVAKERADEQAADDALFFVQNTAVVTVQAIEESVKETVATILAFPGSDKIPQRRQVLKHICSYNQSSL